MILDTLDNAARYAGLGAGIRTALEYLRATDFSTVADGRYPLDGDAVFAIVSRYATKGSEEEVWESHLKFVDVQFVAHGREFLGYARRDRAPAIKTPYIPERDVMFYERGDEGLTLSQGEFAILFPDDVHAPGLDLRPGTLPRHDVLKVVVKVAVTAHA